MVVVFNATSRSFTSGKEARYPLYRMLSGPQGCRKSRPHRGSIPWPSSLQRVALLTELFRPTLLTKHRHIPYFLRVYFRSNLLLGRDSSGGIVTGCASMEQSPSWEHNTFAARQEMSRVVWNRKVHYRLNMTPATWVRSIHAMPPPHFLNTPFNIIRPPQVELFLITFRHPTVGRTPLDEGSAHPRDVYLITHNIHNRHDIHISSGFRTRNPSKRSAADPCLTLISLFVGGTLT
jgi:hypothetical protein